MAMVLAFSLAACGSAEEGGSEEEEESGESEAPAEEESETEEAEEVSAEVEEDTRNWSDSELAEYMAVPDSENIEILTDEEDDFSFRVTGASEEDYETYVGACQYYGEFSKDVTKTSDSYEASNEDGYRISITYDASDESYSGDIKPLE